MIHASWLSDNMLYNTGSDAHSAATPLPLPQEESGLLVRQPQRYICQKHTSFQVAMVATRQIEPKPADRHSILNTPPPSSCQLAPRGDNVNKLLIHSSPTERTGGANAGRCKHQHFLSRLMQRCPPLSTGIHAAHIVQNWRWHVCGAWAERAPQ